MILSDFLSRQEMDKSDLHEIIPIPFDMKAILNDKCYKLEEENSKYMVQNLITSKRKRNKSARSAWIKERYRSKSKTRMVSEYKLRNQ